MRSFLPLVALALVAGAVALSPPSPPESPQPGPATATGSLLLTVRVDARGIRPIGATPKPGLTWRAPRRQLQDFPFHWTIRDVDGAPLATAGFDVSKIDLDPARLGGAPSVEGCFVVPTVTHVNVKVPDYGARMARIDFARADGTPFGSVQATRLGELR